MWERASAHRIVPSSTDLRSNSTGRRAACWSAGSFRAASQRESKSVGDRERGLVRPRRATRFAEDEKGVGQGTSLSS